MEELIRSLAESQKALVESQKALVESHKSNNELLQKLIEAQSANQTQHARALTDTRADKLSQLNQQLRKGKLKDYKPASAENIRDWLSMCDNEIYSLASGVCKLDLTGSNDLNDFEYVELLKSKLDFRVVQELEQKFATQEPATSWSSVTKIKIKELLNEQFGTKEPEISSVLKIFGANRFKKPAEMSVRNYFCKWMDQLHPVFSPKTEAEKDKFIDLIKRSAFYHSLDDPYLQKELSNIKESEQSLSKFHQEAMSAEARRLQYQDTSEKANILDASQAVTVSKLGNTNSDISGCGACRCGKCSANSHVTGAYSHSPHSVSEYRAHGGDSRSRGRGSHAGRGSRGNASRSSNYNDQTFKKKPTCYQCGIYGHSSKYCPGLQDNPSSNHHQQQRHNSNRYSKSNKTSFESDQEEECSFNKVNTIETDMMHNFKV